jgi:hypothetical protein
MPLYLNPESLTEAVERLAHSRARPALCDFLILKRAMTLAGVGTVALSLKDEIFMTSVRQLSLASPAGSEIVTPDPYFNPFGAARDAKHGWRTKKYPSNGTADTVTGPSWQQITEIVSQPPRVVRLREGYEAHLTAIVLQSGTATPSIVDAATWFFRFDDLESTIGASPGDESITDAFTAAVGLTESERQALFPGDTE